MPNLNKVFLMGHLTRDVQLSFLPSQTAIAEFGIATSRKFKKQDGSQGEETCFVDCQIFGKRAEVLNKYVKKGDPLYIEGRLKLDQWKTDAGENRNKMRVMVEDFQFLSKSEKTNKQPMPQEDIPFGD